METSFCSLTIWRERFTNVANLITFSRILLTTVILVIYEDYPAIAFIFLLCAVATDLADGYVARKNGVTEFGGASDRFADKYLFLAIMYMMWDSFKHPAVADFLILQPAILLIYVEISLVVLAFIGYFLDLRVQSKKIGKYKFCFECFTMCFIALFLFTPYLKNFLYTWRVLFAIQMLLLPTAVLAILSLFSYTWEYTGIGWNILRNRYLRFL
jgi:phosphatidylglycerophosphate synthase